MSLGPLAHKIALAIFGLSTLMAVMSVRGVLEARAHRARAEQRLVADDVEGAVILLRRAARWQAPFNVYASAALDELEHIGGLARQQGDTATALSAYRAIHAALHARRSLWWSDRDRLDRAGVSIAALMADGSAGMGGEATRRKAYASALRIERPRAAWALSAVFGFVGWVCGALLFMTRGLDAHGRLVRRIAKRSALAVVIGWVAFVLGLRFT